MDILLTHGYFLQEDEAEKRIMKPYPPLGILYISSYLKSRGVHVEVFDSTFKTKQEFREAIELTRPPIVGIYVNLMTKLNALELIRFCKSQGCVVVVGGPEVPHHAANFLKFGADVAVFGEAEETLLHLLPHLNPLHKRTLHNITGIAFLDNTGGYVQTPARELIADLDTLPFPDRATIDMQAYISAWRTHHGRGSVSLICARGCPFTCTWCSRSVFGETHRRRSPQNVADEIEMLLTTYHPDQLWFADDVFTINHRWFYSFYDEMKRRGIRIPFECITRADRLNAEVLAKMADLGAFRIWYGSESGSQRILDAMERRVSIEKIRQVTKEARTVGIESGLFVMLGYPGEEIEDIDATIDHLKATDPDYFLTTVAYPIKGTALYHEVEHALHANGDWASHTDRQLEFSGRHTPRFYWFATRHLVNEVRVQKLRSSAAGKQLAPLLASFAKSKAARIGMKLTSRKRT